MNETVTGSIFYSDDGRIWGIYDTENTPEEVHRLITPLPKSGVKQVILDMTTTPPTPHIIPNDDTLAELENLQLAVLELEERISELEGEN